MNDATQAEKRAMLANELAQRDPTTFAKIAAQHEAQRDVPAAVVEAQVREFLRRAYPPQDRGPWGADPCGPEPTIDMRSCASVPNPKVTE
jgi:hypothetical protein